jgi:hypothetical protein
MPYAFVVSHYNTLHHSVRILITILLFVFLCLFGRGLFAQSTYVPPKVPDKAIKTLDEAVLTAKTGHTAEAVASINALIEKYPTWTLPRQHITWCTESNCCYRYSIAIATNVFDGKAVRGAGLNR